MKALWIKMDKVIIEKKRCLLYNINVQIEINLKIEHVVCFQEFIVEQIIYIFFTFF